MNIRETIQKHQEAILADRRHLHAHPELSGQEVQTAAYIAEKLREMGLEPQTGVGGHGDILEYGTVAR